jgi:hypothetical protein
MLFQWRFHQIMDSCHLQRERTLHESVGSWKASTQATEWVWLQLLGFQNQVEAPIMVADAVPMALSPNHGQLSSAT